MYDRLIPSRSFLRRLVPCRTIWPCRDRAEVCTPQSDFDQRNFATVLPTPFPTCDSEGTCGSAGAARAEFLARTACEGFRKVRFRFSETIVAERPNRGVTPIG